MKRRILIVASWYPSDAAPVSGIFVEDQARLLLQRFDVTVLVPGVLWPREAWRSGWRDTVSRENRNGVPVYRARARIRVPRCERFVYSAYLRGARTAFQQIVSDAGRPDLIHAHVILPAGWVAWRLARAHRLPVFLTEHSGPFAMHLGTRLRRTLVRRTIEGVDRVLPVSQALADQMAAAGARARMRVQSNVVRTDFFRPPPVASAHTTGHDLRCLCVAALIEQKGVDVLLSSCRLLVQRGHRNFTLTVVGDGRERARLERLTREWALTHQCRFLGSVAREEVRAQMQACDVLVLPSLGETFGLVLGEAMACGKPVIATRCGGPESMVTPECGILVEKANPAALADAMQEFIAGRTHFFADLIRRQAVQRWGEETFLREMAAVYEAAGLP